MKSRRIFSKEWRNISLKEIIEKYDNIIKVLDEIGHLVYLKNPKDHDRTGLFVFYFMDWEERYLSQDMRLFIIGGQAGKAIGKNYKWARMYLKIERFRDKSLTRLLLPDKLQEIINEYFPEE